MSTKQRLSGKESRLLCVRRDDMQNCPVLSGPLTRMSGASESMFEGVAQGRSNAKPLTWTWHCSLTFSTVLRVLQPSSHTTFRDLDRYVKASITQLLRIQNRVPDLKRFCLRCEHMLPSAWVCGLSCCRSHVLLRSRSGFHLSTAPMSCCPPNSVLSCLAACRFSYLTLHLCAVPTNTKQVSPFLILVPQVAPSIKAIRAHDLVYQATTFSRSFPVNSAFTACQSGLTIRFRPTHGVLTGLSPG